ncbi:hypothetical protein BCR34DRAFT_558485 [Clohesyomyces aquaticus]|uniref:Uncharacterized protein n=1 Tax=Clohesyomyces aquaticus TaxID=1231657 RepID=A0A1Y1ZZV2_9PLEO|nr:hypothetical protein BCR34DRAFT_558485 [Clohesyomyces aquaticus]
MESTAAVRTPLILFPRFLHLADCRVTAEEFVQSIEAFTKCFMCNTQRSNDVRPNKALFDGDVLGTWMMFVSSFKSQRQQGGGKAPYSIGH